MRRRMLTLAIFTLAIMCLVTTVATAQIETPEPVVTGPADDNRPSANDTWVAYTHFPLRAFSPDVVARNLETDDRVRVNRKNTHASMGAFDPGTNVVLYQQVYRRRSSLVLYDLDTGERTRAPGVNTKQGWEYHALISSTFITFFRDEYVDGGWETSMFVYRRSDGALRTLWTEELINVEVYNGSVGDRYVAYTICRRTCGAFLYDWVEEDTHRIPSHDTFQWAPVIDEVNGTVYVTRREECGAGANVFRFPMSLEGPPEKIVDLPRGVGTGPWNSLAVNPTTGMMDLWLDWRTCFRGSDVYVARNVDEGPA